MKPILLIMFALTFCFCLKANEVQWGVVTWNDLRVPIPAAQWNNSTKVWLGRSCIGEAGFDAHYECIGIAWVYATRYRDIGRAGKFESVIKKYSAAVKSKSTHKRPWILSLNLNGDKPKKWPSTLSWKVHKPKWLALLNHLDEWAKGNRANPVPTANHFGGSMDKPGKAWVKIKPLNDLKFHNIFYHSPF